MCFLCAFFAWAVSLDERSGRELSPRDLRSERVLGGPPRASTLPGCRRGVARAVALFEFSDGAVMRLVA